jgi:hypothetical protein
LGLAGMMNVDDILRAFNDRQVAYILIGGMNFLLRHAPILTFDVDIWIEDSAENRDRCEDALGALDAEWGATDADWGLVAAKQPGWLQRQTLFCLTSPSGSIDVFRAVKGLESWAACRERAYHGETAGGTAYWGLSDEDMLRSQTALDQNEQKQQRIQTLQETLNKKSFDGE